MLFPYFFDIPQFSFSLFQRLATFCCFIFLSLFLSSNNQDLMHLAIILEILHSCIYFLLSILWYLKILVDWFVVGFEKWWIVHKIFCLSLEEFQNRKVTYETENYLKYLSLLVEMLPLSYNFCLYWSFLPCFFPFQ